MLPLDIWPGSARWQATLPELLGWQGALWVYGEPGSGVSTIGRYLADRRHSAYLDDVERVSREDLSEWLAAHPKGVLMAHSHGEEAVSGLSIELLAFKVASFEEDPEAAPRCAQALAAELGLDSVPPALYALPCPGHLRGLHNRLTRFKLLGQLPERNERSGEGTSLLIQSDDLASNLHALERLLLHRALRRSYGNRMEAARRLGVSRRQLYLLVARHGDPLRGEIPTTDGPKRLLKRKAEESVSSKIE